MAVDLPRRLATVAGMPLGVALTAWFYVWRTTPIHRREVDGSVEADLPPTEPAVAADGVQRIEDGAGPLFHRTYTGRVRDARFGVSELMDQVKADPNVVAPVALARFHKTAGPPWRMEVGDEFLVRMPGPWDGPVRAIEVTPTSFRFVTLAGHLEAGQIEWRAADDDGLLVFQIESWARAGDRLSALLHDRLRMAKEVQLHMWSSVIEKVAGRTHGKLLSGVEIETRRVPPQAFTNRPSGRKSEEE
jgi:hypothetical protein